ncbi:ABC transporter substrate-binding protein [Rhizomonospora bruguierae]|uniref:ABC transporter substrate-binding protein n=1 Tax=Rhizomonospora bruguierae TaxID=1581705 RepID=UPI001BCE053E|nr:extracellular solute-binding protein [Micromonospora sp. NBRC 107566]
MTSVVLPFTLVACGNGGGDGGGGRGSTSLNSLSVDDLYTEAKDEGKVTIYTPLNEKAMAEVAKAFNKTYPGVDVQAITLGVDDLVARVNTEQRGGKFVADVITEDGIHTSQLISINALEPYTPKTMPELPEGVDGVPEGYQSIAFVTTRAVAYNPQTLKKKGIDPPASLEDLTKPEWKRNFSMTPHGADLYTSLIAAMGPDKAKDLLERLGANNPRLVESNSQGITQVQAGEPAAAVSYGTYAAPAKASTPDTVDFINLNPLLTVPYFQVLAKDAPNPAAARLFINWWGTQEGQNVMIKATGFTSVRDDVENNPTVWDPSKWSPVFAPMLSMDEYNAKLNEYREAIRVP